MSQRAVWSALCCCVGRTCFLCSLSFHMEPSPKKVECHFFFLVPCMSVYHDIRTLTRCCTDWIWPSYKIRICIPKPGVIVWRRRGSGGNPFQHSFIHAHHLNSKATLWPVASHMAPLWRRRGGPSYPPTWHNYGLLLRPAPVLWPARRRFKLAILTILSIHNPHKDEMQSWDSLSLLTLPAPYISSKDEKGIVQCYISYRPTTLRKSFNVHRRRPKSSIPPMLNQLSQVYLEYSMSKQICSITQIYCPWYIWIVFNQIKSSFHPILVCYSFRI